MIIFVLWSPFVSAPADRTVPGTHPVEYTLKECCSTLYDADYPLFFILWYIFYFALK